METTEKTTSIGRRDFLKLAGSVVAGLALPKPIRASAKESSPEHQWILTFNENFRSKKLDRSKWNDKFLHGPFDGRIHAGAGQEFQYYAPESWGQHKIENGVLKLIVEKKQNEANKPYVSAMINTRNKNSWKYGYFEMRAKFPSAVGLWPAFWLLPQTDKGQPWPPEIDIVEFYASEENLVHFSSHISPLYPNVGGGTITRSYPGEYRLSEGNFSDSFHTFALHWNKNQISWLVDDRVQFSITRQIPRVQMYMIINLAVNNWWGLPSNSELPAAMDIDYVKVYQKQIPNAV